MVLQGSSPPDEVKLIPRISLLTLLELHGKSIYPVVILDVLWMWRPGKKKTPKKKIPNICPINVRNLSVIALGH